MKLKLLLVIPATFFTVMLSAQHDTHEKHNKFNEEHHRNEVGIAFSPVYFVKEKELSTGIHAHYLYYIPETKFGIGAGYERIFDEHKHNTFGIVASYQPIDHLSLNVSPGITYEAASKSKPAFALHLETAYEFEIKFFHIGPAFEFAYDPEDYHLSLGIHIGFGF